MNAVCCKFYVVASWKNVWLCGSGVVAWCPGGALCRRACFVCGGRLRAESSQDLPGCAAAKHHPRRCAQPVGVHSRMAESVSVVFWRKSVRQRELF